MRATKNTRCKSKFNGLSDGKGNDGARRKEILSIGGTAENLEKDGDRGRCEGGAVDGELASTLWQIRSRYI